MDLSDRPIGQTTSSGCATGEVEHFIGTPSNESSNAESSFSEVSTVHEQGIDVFAEVPVAVDTFDEASETETYDSDIRSNLSVARRRTVCSMIACVSPQTLSLPDVGSISN